MGPTLTTTARLAGSAPMAPRPPPAQDVRQLTAELAVEDQAERPLRLGGH
ncbi:hypothetical protein [Streptomyces erythrochromogenes]